MSSLDKISLKLAFVLVGLSVVPGMGSSARADTLEDAVLAGLSNPEILEVEANRRATDSELRQARGLYYPSIDLRGATGEEGANNSNTRGRVGGGGDDRWLWRSEASIALRQMIYDGNNTDNIVERQKARVKAAAGRVFERSEFLALNTVQAYLEVLRQAELARLSRDNVTAHQNTLNDVLSRVRAGSSSSADLSQSENRLTVAQSDYVEAQRRVDDANTSYLRLVRQQPTGLVRPAVPTTVLPQTEDDAVRRALKANPSVSVAELDREAAVADSRAAEANYLPRLDFEVVGSKGNNLGGIDGQNDDLTLMLVAKWNLYNGGSDSARVSASRERILEAQERTNRFRLVSEEEVRKSWTAMVRQREQTAKLADRVRAAESVYAAYRQQFDIGRRDVLDVLNAQNDLYNARSAALTADYSAQFATYRILAVCGDLLGALNIAPPKASMN